MNHTNKIKQIIRQIKDLRSLLHNKSRDFLIKQCSGSNDVIKHFKPSDSMIYGLH